jgi:hypothetical protein
MKKTHACAVVSCSRKWSLHPYVPKSRNSPPPPSLDAGFWVLTSPLLEGSGEESRKERSSLQELAAGGLVEGSSTAWSGGGERRRLVWWVKRQGSRLGFRVRWGRGGGRRASRSGSRSGEIGSWR